MKYSECAISLADAWLTDAPFPSYPSFSYMFTFNDILNNIDPQWERDRSPREERCLFYCLVASILEDMGQ